MFIDLERLRTDLKHAASAAFAEVRAAHSTETFYAFALYTTDDLAGILPASNSEQALARAIARYRFKDERENIFLRWATTEWEYEAFGADRFNASYDALAKVQRVDDEAFTRLREQILDLMVEVLAALDADGVFGRGPERDRVTLMCSVVDADAWSHEFRERSIRTLNPPAVVAAYEASLRQANAPKANKGPPCPKCGQPLRTAKAQQCFSCGAKWHGQSTVG